MDIDYGAWCHAIAMVETGDNWHLWGDSGQACGRYQMHPAFVWQYGPEQVGLADTWDQVFAQALQAFFLERNRTTNDPCRIAMEFHLGVHAVASGKWDDEYERKFWYYYGSQA